MATGDGNGRRELYEWLFRGIAAVVPLMLAALVTIAWQNSHTLDRMSEEEKDLRRDLETLQAGLVPGGILRLRSEQYEKEIEQLRVVVEQMRLACQPTPGR
jgi:hypothetical protein